MNLKKNKDNAIAFYKMAYKGEAHKAVKLYVGDKYIQHNPDVKDGKDGFVEYFDRMQKEYPQKSINFLRCIAEDELVALHTLQNWPKGEQYVTMDFFRFDTKGKIIEHWDAIQKVPDSFQNSNGMA